MSSIFFLTGILLVYVSVTAAANTTACRCKIITKVECGVTCDDYYSPMPEIDASNPADGSCTILNRITCPENYNVFFSKNDVKTVVAPGDLEAGRVQTSCSRENGWNLKDAEGVDHSFTHVGCDTCRCGIEKTVLCAGCPSPQFTFSYPPTSVCAHIASVTCPSGYDTLALFNQHTSAREDIPANSFSSMMSTYQCYTNGTQSISISSGAFVFTHIGCLPGTLTTTPKPTCPCKTFKVKTECGPTCDDYTSPPPEIETQPGVCSKVTNLICPSYFSPFVSKGTESTVIHPNDFENGHVHGECEASSWKLINSSGEKVEFTHVGCRACSCEPKFRPMCRGKGNEPSYDCPNAIKPNFTYGYPPEEKCIHPVRIICPDDNQVALHLSEGEYYMPADSEYQLIYGCHENGTMTFTVKGADIVLMSEYVSCYPPPHETETATTTTPAIPDSCDSCVLPQVMPLDMCSFLVPDSGVAYAEFNVTRNGDKCELTTKCNLWHFQFEDGDCTANAKETLICKDGRFISPFFNLGITYIRCMNGPAPTPSPSDSCDSCLRPEVMPPDMCSFLEPSPNAKVVEFNVTKNGDQCELTTNCQFWQWQFEDGECSANAAQTLICEDGVFKSPYFPSNRITHIRCEEDAPATPSPLDSCDSCIRPQLMPADMCSFIGPLPNAKVLEFNVTKNGDKCELTTNCKIWDFRLDDGGCFSNMIQPLICEDGVFKFPHFPGSIITHIRCAEEERPTPSPDPCDSCTLPQQLTFDVCSDLNPIPNSPPVEFNVTKNGDTCQLTTNCKIWQTKYENDDDCIKDVAETLTCKHGYYKGYFEEGITHIRCDDAPKPTPAPSDPCDSCVLPQVMPLDMCSFLVPDSGVAHAEFNVTRNGDKCELTTSCDIWQWQFEDGQCANNAAQTLICKDGRYKSPIFNLGITHIRCEDGPALTTPAPSDPCDCPLPEEMPPEVCTELPPPTGEQPAVQFNVTRNGESCELTTNCQIMQIQFDDDEEFCGSTLVKKLICENGRYTMPPFDQPVKYMRCDNAN